MKNQHSREALCSAFVVSRSGYYDWLNSREHPGKRASEDAQISQDITRIHASSRGTYGSPRIAASLRLEGRRHGRSRIARLMRSNGLCGRQKGRYRVQTTDSNHDHPIAPNRLAALPAPQRPNEVWVADITYIPTEHDHWLYLAAVMDLGSRRIVGWAMSASIDTQLVLDALAMARHQRRPPTGLLFHSDRGVQYASGDFRDALQAASLVPSMSRKANCYDNAAMESFWATLKLELVYRTRFLTHADAHQQIFDYIARFYNTQRLHSALGYLSPAQFEQQS
jgi:transposase InsO family protein